MKVKIFLVGIIAASLLFNSVKDLAAEQTKEQPTKPAGVEKTVKEKDAKIFIEFYNKANTLARKASVIILDNYNGMWERGMDQYKKNYEEIVSNWKNFIEKYPNNFYVSDAKEYMEMAQNGMKNWENKSLNEIHESICGSHLKQLGLALQMYAQAHNNKFPDDLKKLLSEKYISTPRIFWCPADTDPIPIDITNSTSNTANSSQISYTYYPGHSTDESNPDERTKTVIMEDNTTDHHSYNHHKGWKNRLYLDGHVEAAFVLFSSNPKTTKQENKQYQNAISCAYKAVTFLKKNDMVGLSKLVHPQKGVRFSPYGNVYTNNDLVFSEKQVAEFRSDKKEYIWGRYDGSGHLIILTWPQYMKRFVYNRDYLKADAVSVNHDHSSGNTINNAISVYPNALRIEYYFEQSKGPEAGIDWCALRLILEEYNDNWCIVGIIHDQWTI